VRVIWTSGDEIAVNWNFPKAAQAKKLRAAENRRTRPRNKSSCPYLYAGTASDLNSLPTDGGEIRQLEAGAYRTRIRTSSCEITSRLKAENGKYKSA